MKDVTNFLSYHRGNKIYQAFTLIEAIVVLVIIVIFTTIWYRSLIIYHATSRDSARIIDMWMIQRTLEYHSLQEGFYPYPEYFFEITYDWSSLWRQGIFWEKTREITRRIGNAPIDPLTWNHYIYSVTYNRQEFQLGGIIEWGLFTYKNNIHLSPPLVSQTFAQNYQSKIIGNYNKKIIALYEDNNIIILWVPSIISSSKWEKDIQEVYNMWSFVIAWKTYLPDTYYYDIEADNIYLGLSFRAWNMQTTSAPILYNDTIDNFNTLRWREIFWNNLISYYWDSNIYGLYNDIISTSDPLQLVTNYIKRDIWWLSRHVLVSKESYLSHHNCSDWFILVPWDAMFNTKDFCVSQYHMSYIDADNLDSYTEMDEITYNTVPYEPDKPIVSMAWRHPIANINQQEAIDTCKSLWSGYHLITNDQWMTIARNIEAYNNWKIIYNWVSGDKNLWCDSTWGNNEIRKKGTRTWYGDDETCNNKRMYKLSNGNIIWDFSGNIWSHVNKANNISGVWHNAWHTSIQWSSHPTDWDRDGIYHSDDMVLYGSAQWYGIEYGMGSVWYAKWRDNNVFLRGWSAGTQKYAWIFSLFLNFTSDSRSEHVGFRCAR